MLDFAGKNVVVMGLGRFGGGVGVSRWLAGQGARVMVTDQSPAATLQGAMAQLADLPIEYQLGSHYPAVLEKCDLLVVNPAVDKTRSEFFQRALRLKITLTTEMNIFVQRCPAKIIGITGTVGKSTTTAMIHHLLSAALQNSHEHPPRRDRRRCWMGGNIGRSLLGELREIKAEDLVVLELSSFMLENTPWVQFSPHVAVVTNLRANHLDRYGSLPSYAAAKQNILRFQRPGDFAILNDEDDVIRSWSALTPADVSFYSTAGLPPLDLAVPGRHNQSNARAALAVLGALRLAGEPGESLAALGRFTGLPHRLELVHTSRPAPGRDVRWFNDSKATTPEAAMVALAAFPARSFVMIVGGYDKHADMTEFTRQLAATAGGVLGIGATGKALVAGVNNTGLSPANRCAYVDTLENAIAAARQWISPNAAGEPELTAVVLSPGCASYGQFVNYEERGERFAALARATP